MNKYYSLFLLLKPYTMNFRSKIIKANSTFYFALKRISCFQLEKKK